MTDLNLKLTKTKTAPLPHKGIRCGHCKDVIFSRAHYDFHFCSCGGAFVDGGFDYMRSGGKTEREFIQLTLHGVTKEDLYKDWNSRADQFGIIAEKQLVNLILTETQATKKKCCGGKCHTKK